MSADWTYKGKKVDSIPEEYEGFVYLITNTKNGKKFGYVEWMDAFFDPTNIDYKVIDKCIVEGKYTLEKNLHDITSFHENIFNSHLDKIKLGKDSEGYKTSFNFIEEYFSREVIKI